MCSAGDAIPVVTLDAQTESLHRTFLQSNLVQVRCGRQSPFGEEAIGFSGENMNFRIHS